MVKEADTLGIYARNFDDIWDTHWALRGQVPPAAPAAEGDDSPPDTSLPNGLDHAPRIAVWKHQGWEDIEPASEAAMEEATALLRSLGATVEEITLPPDFDDICDQHQLILHDGLAQGLAGKGGEERDESYKIVGDLYHEYTWHGHSTHPLMTENLMEMIDNGNPHLFLRCFVALRSPATPSIRRADWNECLLMRLAAC